MNKRSRTQSKKFSTPSGTMKNRLKERRQTKINAKADKSRAFKSKTLKSGGKRGKPWTDLEHKTCM